jgi:hypothetical protein
MTEKDAILGLIRDPELDKANSTLEFVVGAPEMDEVAAEWDFVVGNAECNLVGRDYHESSPWPRLSVRRSRTLRVDFHIFLVNRRGTILDRAR